jgi:adenylate kinase family enzyme
MNKGIIILGSVGSGKTHFEEELWRWTDFMEPEIFNRLDPDIWVENEDHEFYNNPLKASNYMYKTVIPNIMELPMNFILQNTGANINTLRKIIDNKQYQFKIVVVYCNPIIAFLRNFSRERKVPKQVVLENWLKVYSQIEEYIELVGKDNIYIYETEYTKEEQDLLSYLKLKDNYYLSNLAELIIEIDIEITSSFRNPTKEYTLEQQNKNKKQFNNICSEIDNKYIIINDEIQINKIPQDFIKDEINKWINK